MVAFAPLAACCMRPAGEAACVPGLDPATGAASAAPPAPAAPGSLREAAAPTNRRIGVALATWFFGEAEYPALAARQFDSITAENEMKWDAVEPDPGRFAFEAGDRLVAFAEGHRMRVRGHTLVWHNQLAPWVRALPSGELKGAMLRHVRATVEHWRGRIAQWDVVNEALDETGNLRVHSPFSALGPSYIEDAFRAAHEADPQALLFYNDYDIEAENLPKTEGVYRLVKQLKERGVPIHGIGFQMHLDPRDWPDAEEMRRNLTRFADLGLSIELTEIDVPIGEIPGSLAQKLAAQRDLARGVVTACLSVPACTGMTFWGLTDKHSWLATPEWAVRRGSGPHLPLPFDENYQPKPMYAGILDALLGP
jgi:endo-1,4-beta-xylanase